MTKNEQFVIDFKKIVKEEFLELGVYSQNQEMPLFAKVL